MVDTNALVTKWLRNIPALTSLLPTRGTTNSIYAVSLPPKFSPSDGPAITIMANGGLSHPEINDLIQPRLQIKVWADVLQYEIARQVYGVLFDSIHGKGNITISGAGTIMSCYEITPPQDLADPDMEWATVISFYQLIARS